jgi:hypothetical protein
LGRLPDLNGVEFMGIPRSVLHSFNCALFAGNYRQNEHGEMMKEQLFRLDGAQVRDPAIDKWMEAHGGELGDMARTWFEGMRRCWFRQLDLAPFAGLIWPHLKGCDLSFRVGLGGRSPKGDWSQGQLGARPRVWSCGLRAAIQAYAPPV